ncbi:hypothetical protein HRbin19_00103 [bacterium HR19]|nr:hypothetical protein HRbin19_00103 [bacterium HR19]
MKGMKKISPLPFLMLLFFAVRNLYAEEKISKPLDKGVLLEIKNDPFSSDEKESKEKKEKNKLTENKNVSEGKREVKVIGKVIYEENGEIKNKLVIIEIDKKPYILKEGDEVEGIKVEKITEQDLKIVDKITKKKIE